MRISSQSTRRGPAGRATLLALLVAAVAAGGPARGAERLTARALGSALRPASGAIALPAAAAGGAARFALGDGSAIGLELEYAWRPRVGVELTVLLGEYDVDLAPAPGAAGAPARGSLGSETYTLGLNYRFARAGRCELRAGAFGGLSYYDDVTLPRPASGRPETFRFDDDLGFGVKLGADLPLDRSGRWLASAAARFASSILEGEEAGRDLDVDPLIVTLGVGYRF